MLPFSFSSLRVRLIILVVLAVIPALGLILSTAAEQRRQATLEVQANALRLARAASLSQERYIEGARQFLTALAHFPAVRAGDATECSALFADIAKQYAFYTGFTVARPDGEVFCSSLPLPGPLNIADRAFFQRALAARDFVVGEYVIGRITGRPILTFAYPVLDEAGRVQAVITTGLDLAWLNEFAAGVSLPEGAVLAVTDRNGIILARYPDPEQRIGQAMPPAFVEMLAQGEGAGEKVGVDGVERLFGFTSLRSETPEGDVYVSIGIPRAVAFADADRVLVRSLMGLGMVALLALAAVWGSSEVLVLRPVRALVRATRRLRAGDLRARTGLPPGQGELSQLARAFDEMAGSLEGLTSRIKLILDSAGEGIYGLDAQGRAIFLNPAAARMLGAAVEDFIGQPMHALVHHARPDGTPYPPEACPIYAALRDGTVHHVTDEVLWRKDGTSFPVEYVSTPIQEDGKPVGAVVVFKDITDGKRAEEELQAHARQQAAVARLGQRALAGADLAALMGEVAALVTQTLQVEYCKVLELLPDGHALLLRAGVGWKAGLVGQATVEAGPGSQAGYTLQSGGPVILEDLRTETRFRGPLLLVDHRVVSGVSVIIAGRERPFGVLGAHTARHRTFTQDDVNFLQAVAHVLATAIERTRAEQALRESEARKAAILESALDCVISIDQEGRIIEFNPAAEETFGYRRDEVVGQQMAELIIPPALRARHYQGLAQYLATGEGPILNQRLEMTAIRADGSEFPVELTVTRIPTDGPPLFTGFLRDITERTRAENERARLLAREREAHATAEAQRRRLLTVLEQIPVGVAIAEALDGQLSWNSAGRRLYPPAEDRIERWRTARFLHPDGQLYAFEDLPLVRALRGETVLGAEVVYERPDGARTILLANAAPVSDEHDRFIAAVAVFQDITRRKTLEQMKDEFLSLAAHELKTPLTAIKGTSQLLLRQLARGRTTLGEQEARLLQTIDDRTDYMVGLVSELLDLSRIATGRLALRPAPMDLAALLREVVAQQQVLSPDYSFTLEGAEEPVWGAWDRGRLEQVFTNLLDNAAKYSPAGRPITVRLRASADQAHVAVQDRGIGIPAGELPYLFERHFRASNVGMAPSGLGLGLYLSSQIVQRLGGRIWAESVEGQGSTFHVELHRDGAAAIP
ncbi:MAG: PAS domain S-box protein [Chloroflexi bacterium]|nr:PAS domain S-box protein [Chloroflexota bacterium]